MMKSKAVDKIPMKYMPAPTAIPMAAVAQTPAAVVRPEICSFLTKIVPAPMKEIPVTIWAAILEGSSERSCMLSRSVKPYLDTIMNKAEAIATTMCVLTPAVFLWIARS